MSSRSTLSGTSTGFETAVRGTAAVQVSLKDVVESWLESFYERFPCSEALVDIGVDENGSPVGIWDFGTPEEPFVKSGGIDATRKEIAVMEIASSLLEVLKMPDRDREFLAAIGGCEEDDEDDVEDGIEENGMVGDVGEGVLHSEGEGADRS